MTRWMGEIRMEWNDELMENERVVIGDGMEDRKEEEETVEGIPRRIV